MERKKRCELIAQLKHAGLRYVSGFPSLYINSGGKLFNMNTCQYEQVNTYNRIKYNGINISIPKLVLLAFAGEPYHPARQIRYVDRNRSNMDVSNLQYSAITSEPVHINHDRLYKAIRCHFRVSKRFNTKDMFQTRLYLSVMCSRHSLSAVNRDDRHLKMFLEYLSDLTINRVKIANQHNIPVKEVGHIFNVYINRLADDVLRELEAGNLQALEYLPTKAENSLGTAMAEWDKIVAELK